MDNIILGVARQVRLGYTYEMRMAVTKPQASSKGSTLEFERLKCRDGVPVDVSDFVTVHRFPCELAAVAQLVEQPPYKR